MLFHRGVRKRPAEPEQSCASDWRDTAVIWSRQPAAKWPARAFFCAAEFNGSAIILGGLVGGEPSNDVWVSSDRCRQWSLATAAAAWPARCDFATAVLGRHLYVLGGATGPRQRTNDVWRTANGVAWECVTCHAGWSARSGHAACVLTLPGGGGSGQQMIALSGGCDDTGCCADIWLSRDGVSWTRATASHPDAPEACYHTRMPPRAYHSSVALRGGSVLLLGGRGANGGGCRSVWVWTPAAAAAAAAAAGSSGGEITGRCECLTSEAAWADLQVTPDARPSARACLQPPL
jgi:hypothetical protein